MFLQSIEKFILDDSNYVNLTHYYVRIYRWNPYFKVRPWFHIFPLRMNQITLMSLDLLFDIKSIHDTSLTFRRSCREGICGSCSMNINGLNTLACLKFINLQDLQFLTVYPLPHFLIVKDLICDLLNFYNQLLLIKPWIMLKNEYSKLNSNFREIFQSKLDRYELDGLYECVLCACCSASCPSYWWNYNKYLGPAILLQSYRWLADSRDEATGERLEELEDPFKLYRCHTIMNCTNTCPKGLNPGKAIAEIKSMIAEKNS